MSKIPPGLSACKTTSSPIRDGHFGGGSRKDITKSSQARWLGDMAGSRSLEETSETCLGFHTPTFTGHFMPLTTWPMRSPSGKRKKECPWPARLEAAWDRTEQTWCQQLRARRGRNSNWRMLEPSSRSSSRQNQRRPSCPQNGLRLSRVLQPP